MKLRESLTAADAWPAEQIGSTKSFTQLLRDHGFKPVKVDKQRCWKGLSLGQSDFAKHDLS